MHSILKMHDDCTQFVGIDGRTYFFFLGGGHIIMMI